MKCFPVCSELWLSFSLSTRYLYIILYFIFLRPTYWILFAHYLYTIYTLPINYLVQNNIFTLSTYTTNYLHKYTLSPIYSPSTHYLRIYSISTHIYAVGCGCPSPCTTSATPGRATPTWSTASTRSPTPATRRGSTDIWTPGIISIFSTTFLKINCLKVLGFFPPDNQLSYCYRRQRKEREVENLANGINFQYTSPFMTDRHSLVKQSCNTNEGRFSNWKYWNNINWFELNVLNFCGECL